MTVLEKYIDGSLVLPSVVDCITFENHLVLDVLLHKDQMLKTNDELSYNGVLVVIEKKLKDEPVRTEYPFENRLSIRRVRFYCKKISL